VVVVQAVVHPCDHVEVVDGAENGRCDEHGHHHHRRLPSYHFHLRHTLDSHVETCPNASKEEDLRRIHHLMKPTLMVHHTKMLDVEVAHDHRMHSVVVAVTDDSTLAAAQNQVVVKNDDDTHDKGSNDGQ